MCQRGENLKNIHVQFFILQKMFLYFKIYICMHLQCAALTASALLFSLEKKKTFLKAKQGSESKTLFIRLTVSRTELLVRRWGDPASKHQYVQSA